MDAGTKELLTAHPLFTKGSLFNAIKFIKLLKP